ncbi:HET domain-containing protein [Fusarium sp. LHS14.1]|nr:HET domain-containing protein [Fusarium sp. LHS14.1]
MEERNHQVQLMKSIYSSAPLALAWLGHLNDAHLAVSLAESLSPPHSLEFMSNMRNLDYSSWMHANPHLWTVSEGRNAHWEAFKVLAESPYWTRTWTFQEMVLPSQVLFMCSPSLVAWQHVMAVQELVLALYSMVTHSILPTTRAHEALCLALLPFLTAKVPLTREIYETRRKLDATSNPPNLTLVPSLVNSQATDPRDRVYGLLGVIETRLEADYTKDTAQVYLEFASAWIHELKDLNLLLYCQAHCRNARHGPKPLPSWAPDWEAISQEKDDIKNHLDSGADLAGPFYSNDASMHLPPGNPHLVDDLSTLIASGVVAGKVEEVYPRWPSDISDTDLAVEVLQLVIRCRSSSGSHLEPSGSPSGPRLHIFQTLFRTIIPDMGLKNVYENRDVRLRWSSALCLLVGLLAWAVESERPDWQSVAALYLPRLGIPIGKEFSRAWKEEIFKGYIAEINVPDCENAAAAMESTWENAKECISVMRQLTKLILRPYVKFVTNNGYLGISNATQAGDMVVVLADCKAPVLLRRRGSHYEHVGPCFVMGLLDGEAKEMVDRGDAKIERFEIR